MCLSEIKRGQRVYVVHIEDESVRTQLIRLGICKGSLLQCLEKIPYGPFMLRHRRQEISVGREIARRIVVEGGAGPCR